MVKIALSATISETIPTTPLSGMGQSLLGWPCSSDAVTVLIVSSASLRLAMHLHSYLESVSSGCFKSQSGLRLATTGSAAKL